MFFALLKLYMTAPCIVFFNNLQTVLIFKVSVESAAIQSKWMSKLKLGPKYD